MKKKTDNIKEIKKGPQLRKAKRKGSNKAGSIIGDYYLTGREYTKQNKEAYEEKYGKGKKAWTTREKVYLIVCIIGAIAIALKYLVFK